MQRGHELAADSHEGWTGDQNKDNTHRLNLRELLPNEPLTLVMEVEPASSNDTAGDIEIRREDAVPPKP